MLTLLKAVARRKLRTGCQGGRKPNNLYISNVYFITNYVNTTYVPKKDTVQNEKFDRVCLTMPMP